jgi:hypothetical protein
MARTVRIVHVPSRRFVGSSDGVASRTAVRMGTREGAPFVACGNKFLGTEREGGHEAAHVV